MAVCAHVHTKQGVASGLTQYSHRDDKVGAGGGFRELTEEGQIKP